MLRLNLITLLLRLHSQRQEMISIALLQRLFLQTVCRKVELTTLMFGLHLMMASFGSGGTVHSTCTCTIDFDIGSDLRGQCFLTELGTRVLGVTPRKAAVLP